MRSEPIISVAPMMNYTDRHDRYFLRLIAPHVELYTEMITSYALLHGDIDYLLAFHPDEKYLALQLGGSDPSDLAKCAAFGEDAGYDEINLNVGCPSPRVSKGRFGACLMLEPDLVADCVAAMSEAVKIPVTVKCRLGVDNEDSEEKLHAFIEKMIAVGVTKVIIHARKAWLKGLNPKQNRTIPPLKYEAVYRVKKRFPQLKIIINGGIQTCSEIDQHLAHVDGVMLGRTAYAHPYLLAEIEAKYFKNRDILSRRAVLEKLLPYIRSELAKGVKLTHITRHLLGLFHGQPGAANWRRFLTEEAHKTNAGIEVLTNALAFLP